MKKKKQGRHEDEQIYETLNGTTTLDMKMTQKYIGKEKKSVSDENEQMSRPQRNHHA